MDPIRCVAVVGFGTIGQRWAAAFAHRGLKVRCHDPDPRSEVSFATLRPGLEADLMALDGPARPGGAISLHASLVEALDGADFVQECGPEQLDLKQDLLSRIDRHAAPGAVIASSSSALRVTEMQARCERPGRVVLGHPFNPAHLMPLVEVVGGERTDPAAVRAALAFYEAIGKKPVSMTREVTGHLALRLMAALWREAIALVRDGIATVEDVDRAFVYGPGPKWALQGAFISNALNADGMASFLEKYGPTYDAIWRDLGTASLDPPTRASVTRGTADLVGTRGIDDLREARDAGLVAMLKVLQAHGAL